jgi:hypothetical protein
VYDESRSRIGGDYNNTPAANVKYSFSSQPNSLYYIRVEPYDRSSGAYTLTVRPEQAYDAYEPNNDFFHAAPIGIGRKIEANIMDPNEIDFFQFRTREAANLIVLLDNASTTLEPQIDVYDQSRSRIGGNYNNNPAGNISYSFTAQSNSLYYMRVEPCDRSSGAYILTVRPQ